MLYIYIFHYIKIQVSFPICKTILDTVQRSNSATEQMED